MRARRSQRKTGATFLADALGRRGGVSVVHHDRADRLALVHQVEGRVDLVERHGVGDQVVDVDLALHVPVDDLRHVGAAARAAEGGALPDPAGDELERAGRDLLAGCRRRR